MGIAAQFDRVALAPDEFIAQIWQERRRYVREGKIKQPHPWRVALSQGRVSRRALNEYVKNRYYFLANINRKDAQVIANCPISDARRMLLRKYIDEEGQDVAGGQQGQHGDPGEQNVRRGRIKEYAEFFPGVTFAQANQGNFRGDVRLDEMDASIGSHALQNGEHSSSLTCDDGADNDRDGLRAFKLSGRPTSA